MQYITFTTYQHSELRYVLHRVVPMMIFRLKFDLLCKGGCDNSSQSRHVKTTIDTQGLHGGTN